MSADPVKGTAPTKSKTRSAGTPRVVNPFMPSLPRRGRRIAEKLFLSYVLPLAVLIVAGLVLPFVLWSYLGQSVQEYQQRIRIADDVGSLYRAGINGSNQARGIILYRDPSFEQQFAESRTNFSNLYRSLLEHFDAQNETELKTLLLEADREWRVWNWKYVNPELRALRGLQNQRNPSGQIHIRSNKMRLGFVTVGSALDKFVIAANKYRDEQRDRAQFADTMRHIIVFFIPTVAMLLAVLIGRSIALGITRPLEALTTAARELEKGNAAALLLAKQIPTDHSDDEIGELQHAFTSMGQTISQREAMLRAQNEAQEALNQRIAAVLNATNDGIVMLDRAAAFSVVNQRFANLFGIETDVLLYQTFDKAAPLFFSRFRQRNEARARFESLLNDPDTIMDEPFEVIEPLARTLRVFSAPVRGDMDAEGRSELLGRILVFRDVTRETQSDRMKTEFVSTVSHELRTPLTAIKGYVDLMVNGKTGPLNNVQTEFLTTVQSSTTRLTALINDILDISRIEAGRMEIRQESVDYLPLVQEAVRVLQREADEQGVTLSIETQQDDPNAVSMVYGDSDRITQVLVNFLSNGIKYTPAGGSVTVRVAFQEDFVTTQIQDTGIGITKEDQSRLFEKFFRADNSSTRETGGTGLGLAITKAILEKLGGSVWVESEPGKGSTFTFTLPTVPATDSAADTPAPVTGGTQRHLVLNVDSDLAVLHRLGYELRQQGFVTANASTMQEALRRARGLRPDLITLDPLMQNLDGFELLRNLKKTVAAKGTPIALLSLRIDDAVNEIRDTRAYLPRTVETDTLAVMAKLLIAAPNDRRSAVVVVADAPTVERVRESLIPFGERAYVVAAASPDEADSHAGALFPDLVILDTNAAPGVAAAQWIAKLRRRSTGTRLPVILLTDPDLLEGNVFSLIAPGSGSLPPSQLGRAIHAALREVGNDSLKANAFEKLLT